MSALGSGMSGNGGSSGSVHALAAYDDGGGSALYAGGGFLTAGGVTVNGIAKWDGSSWSALGNGMNNSTFGVGSLAVHDDGNGATLCVGGDFTTADGLGVNHLAAWDGSSWTSVGSGVNNTTRALAAYDDGGGPALYAGGLLIAAGGGVVNYIAKWNGTSWTALGSGMGGATLGVYALAAHDDGSGPALFAGGDFTTAGGTAASRIAKWNGTSWSAVGTGMSSTVYALTVHDDGGGPELYAGGAFTTAGGVSANGIAKWDGSNWSALGSGANGTVRAFAVYDDGSGPALYAGGSFTSAGGVAAARIAKWSGATWSALGSGLAGGSLVNALAVFDDGSGPALYAGGSGVSDEVHALGVYDDGSGPALFVGGDFETAGGVAVNRIARWDGSSWSALGSGVDGSVLLLQPPSVNALLACNDGNGPALYAAGNFQSALDSGDSFVARWQGCDTAPPTLDCPASIDVVDSFNGPPGEVVVFTVSASDEYDPSPSVVCVPPSGSFFPRGTTMVTCTATDASGNQSTCQFPVTVEVKLQKRKP